VIALRSNPILSRRPEDEQREVSRRTRLTRRSDKRVMIDALHRRNCVRDIEKLPEAGESFHIIARGNFPLWSIVPATLTLAAPATIERLSIATLGFSTSNATDLLSLFDAGRIKAVDIVASVYFERQNPAEYRMMADGLAKRGQRIVALRSHAKIIAMRLSDGKALAIESSANLRSCRNVEQLSIFADAELCDFHARWIAQVIDAAGGKGR
jgi:hypothetical protein